MSEASPLVEINTPPVTRIPSHVGITLNQSEGHLLIEYATKIPMTTPTGVARAALTWALSQLTVEQIAQLIQGGKVRRPGRVVGSKLIAPGP